MTSAVLMLGAGFLLLLGGAEGLVRGAVGLARRLGVPALVIGLTIVAFGTSAPELVVSVRAGLAGSGALAIGNVVGSNIANVGLILGIAALVRPLRVELDVVRRDAPIALLAAVALAAMLLDGTASRLDGVVLTAGIVAYIGFGVRRARRATTPAGAIPEAAIPAVPGGPRGRAFRLAALVAAGCACLAVGADLFVRGAVDLAARLGVSEAVIGLTVVAVGTSLPELVTSTLAAARGHGDIAIGNVVGSNIFNVFAILGPAALLRPLDTAGVSRIDIAVMIGFTVLLLPLLRSGFVLNRREGAVLLLAYLGFVFWCVF